MICVFDVISDDAYSVERVGSLHHAHQSMYVNVLAQRKLDDIRVGQRLVIWSADYNGSLFEVYLVHFE